MPVVYISRSEAETERIAGDLARTLKPGTFIALEGELGAGKTVFARGLARGLGIEGRITSPTFVLLRSYEGRLPLYHYDVYRIADIGELEDIGFYDYACGDGVCLVEWADKVASELPGERIEVRIEGEADGQRKIEVRP